MTTTLVPQGGGFDPGVWVTPTLPAWMTDIVNFDPTLLPVGFRKDSVSTVMLAGQGMVDVSAAFTAGDFTLPENSALAELELFTVASQFTPANQRGVTTPCIYFDGADAAAGVWIFPGPVSVKTDGTCILQVPSKANGHDLWDLSGVDSSMALATLDGLTMIVPFAGQYQVN